MKVADVMTREVRRVEIPGTRSDVLELMKELEVVTIPAVKKDSDEFIGMVTLKALLEKPDEDQLAILVDRKVTKLDPNDDLKKAIKLFLETQERRLPVVDGGKLVGILAVKDVLERVLLKSNPESKVVDLMRPHIIAIWDGTPVRAVAQLLRLSGFMEVPVVDEKGKLVGVVGSVDLLKLSDVETDSKMSQMVGRSESDSWAWDTEARVYITKRELKLPEKPVREIIRKDVVTTSKRTPAVKVAQLMLEHQTREVLVQDVDEKLVGIVRDVDLLKALL